MKTDFENLEQQLRDLGRAMKSPAAVPSPALLETTRIVSAAALVPACLPQVALMRRKWMLRVSAVLVATLPIPLLFMWFDLRTASAVFDALLSPRASVIAATLYTWTKVSLFAAVYMFVPPTLIWFGVKVRVEQPVMRQALQGV